MNVQLGTVFSSHNSLPKPGFGKFFDKLVLVLSLAVLVLAAAPDTSLAGHQSPGGFRDSSLRGTWVWSGLLRFGAPIPIPAELVDGAPPHDQVNPAEVVGIWAAILGTMTFDGAGSVTSGQDVVKSGELKPLPSPFPLDYLPPFPEIFTGNYSVADSGVVEIHTSGRDPSSPEGQVDFEADLHCIIVARHREMQCVWAQFRTFFVDPNGFPSPVTGVITMRRQR